MFDRARYRLEDDSGNIVFLEIDYKNGRFNLVDVNTNDSTMGILKSEASLVASSLIKRKQGVNFSDNIKL